MLFLGQLINVTRREVVVAMYVSNPTWVVLRYEYACVHKSFMNAQEHISSAETIGPHVRTYADRISGTRVY